MNLQLLLKCVYTTSLLAITACQNEDNNAQHSLEAQAKKEILLDTSIGQDWPAYGRTYGEQHYSPLSEITSENTDQLGLAWFMDLDRGNPVTVPIAVDGVLYFASGYSVIHAINAATGKLLWSYDPNVAEVAGRKMRMGWGSRGIAYWNNKIYTAAADGRLIAVDVKTGQPVWEAMTLPKDDGRFITGAPRVFDGKIIIGHGGAETTSTRSYVTVYDTETGKQLWRFFIVPGNPSDGFEDETQEMAAKTWSGEWWKHGGGGHAWNAFTYDPETNTVFIGTGNGSPWNQKLRSAGKGDNLFLCSIVALDANTGTYKWHYQVNPGETWDYNATMDMQLANLMIDGELRKVVMQAPKNGFLYVIDRMTGELISAEKIAKVTWAEKIDLKTGRPVEIPGARYPEGKDFELWPSYSGAHSWQPSAFNPKSGLLYIPLMESGTIINDRGITPETWKRHPGYAVDYGVNVSEVDNDPLNHTGWLLAIDPATQKTRWKLKNPTKWNSGLLTSAGNLVFQGHSTGKFNAYDALSGNMTWEFEAQAPIFSTPITYQVNGQQYITLLVGAGTSAGLYALPGKNDAVSQVKRVLTFKLGGKSSLPPQEIIELVAAEDPSYQANETLAQKGASMYGIRCAHCHGGDVISGGTAPDLRASLAPTSSEIFSSIVRGGALEANGMPRFEELEESELSAIRHYIRSRADALRAE